MKSAVESESSLSKNTHYIEGNQSKQADDTIQTNS